MACPFCIRAVSLLSAKNIDFEKIDVTQAKLKTGDADRTNGKHQFHKFLSMMIILAAAMIYSALIRQAISDNFSMAS